MVEEDDWAGVQSLLEADMPHLKHEVAELYDEMDRYSRVADAMDTAGREDDAEYFRELAVDRYESFENAIQLKKDADDYKF